jgi:hypothetical protein
MTTARVEFTVGGVAYVVTVATEPGKTEGGADVVREGSRQGVHGAAWDDDRKLIRQASGYWDYTPADHNEITLAASNAVRASIGYPPIHSAKAHWLEFLDRAIKDHRNVMTWLRAESMDTWSPSELRKRVLAANDDLTNLDPKIVVFLGEPHEWVKRTQAGYERA